MSEKRPSRPKRAASFVASVTARFVEHRITRHSAALAFYTLVSLAPVSVAVLGLAGTFFEEATARQRIVQQFDAALGAEAGDVVEGVLESVAKGEKDLLAGAVGFFALIFGMTAVFVQLQDALNTVFGIPERKGRLLPAIVRKRLLSFLMVLLLGVLLVITLSIGAILSFVRGAVGGFPALELSLPITLSTNEIASFFLLTILFALIYWLLPDADLDFRDAVSGAVVTSLLFAVGRFLIGLYLSQSDRASPYGTASSLVLFLLWIYFSSLVFLLGAELTREWAERAGRLPERRDGS